MYTLTIDGGCRNNQDRLTARAYFSMRLTGKGKVVPMTVDGNVLPNGVERQSLPISSRQTNQVAELYAYLIALQYLCNLSTRCATDSKQFPVIEVRNDSKYALGFVTGANRKSKDNLALVRDIQACVRCLDGLPITYKHVPRADVELVLGH